MPYTKDRTDRESYTYTYTSDLSGVPVTQTTQNRVSYVNTKTGEYLPKWKQLVRDGADATTPFDGTRRSGKSFPGAMNVTYWHPLGSPRQFQKPKQESLEGMFYTPAVPGFSTGADLALANNQALSRLLNDVRKNNNTFSGGVFLGEIREVMRMIRSPAKLLREGIGDYFSTLRKRKGRAPKHRLKDILSSTWLEYSFGWQPLLSDVKAAAEALARFENDSRRSSARGYGISETLNSNSVSQGNSPNYFRFNEVFREKAVAKVIYRCGLKYETAAPFGSANRLAELSGFTLADFVPTIWELVPWSFIVDYFSNVGDILSCATTDTSHVTYKCKSEVRYVERTLRSIPDIKLMVQLIGANNVISMSSSSLGGYNSVHSTVKRRSVSSLGIPSLTFYAPALDSVKWINLAALTAASRSLTPYRK